MLETSNFANQLLIAMPGLNDPNFSRSVTFLCQHNEDGALGIVINRLSDLRLNDLLEQMQIMTALPEVANAPVFIGGPVQTDRGFVLHEPGGDWHSTVQVSPEVSLTTSRDVLEAMAIGEGPRRTLVALGYAGWGAGQLEQEMLANSWLSVAAAAEVLFHAPIETRWGRAVALAGIDPNRLSSVSGHA